MQHSTKKRFLSAGLANSLENLRTSPEIQIGASTQTAWVLPATAVRKLQQQKQTAKNRTQTKPQRLLSTRLDLTAFIHNRFLGVSGYMWLVSRDMLV